MEIIVPSPPPNFFVPDVGVMTYKAGSVALPASIADNDFLDIPELAGIYASQVWSLTGNIILSASAAYFVPFVDLNSSTGYVIRFQCLAGPSIQVNFRKFNASASFGFVEGKTMLWRIAYAI